MAIPTGVTWVNMVPVFMSGEDIGHINHVVKQIDGQVFLCSVDVLEGKEEFVRKIIK